MPRLPPTLRKKAVLPRQSDAPNLGETKTDGDDHTGAEPLTLPDALIRMNEAEDTLRAIGAGEIDAFVVTDHGLGRRVFTLSTADRPYRMFVENMRDGAATLSANGLVLYANQRLADLLACSREDIIGLPLATFVHGGAPSGLQEHRDRSGLSSTIECELLAVTGDLVPVLVGVSSLEVDGGHLSCLTFTDLSAQKSQDREIARLSRVQAEKMAELEHAQAALTEQATHDSLTGLPNRGLLVDRIGQALALAERTRRCTAVFFIDLDRFKQVNDTHGHAVGDSVLQEVAEHLVGVLRSADTVARIGGDEFVVLAHDVDSRLHAVDIGTRLATELRKHSPWLKNGEPVTASIGIAVSVAGRGNPEILLEEADAAMYQAKSLGGARAEVFDAALDRQVRQRSSGRRMLQSALDDRRLIPFYQPIINLSTGRITGFEALARIREVDGSIVPPAAFIAVAEESGLVVPLGAQVLHAACRQAASWQAQQPTGRPLTVAVNLASRQFERGDLTSIIRTELETTGLQPEHLHLELTETAIIDLRPDMLQQLSAIRDLGVELGLDDFGTGYGSLTHLRRLPLSFVKIDQSFVQGLGNGVEDDRIVAAVVTLAANLNLRSIGEGVETAEQLGRLRELGCDHAQGYLFAKPMPAAEVPAIIPYSAF